LQYKEIAREAQHVSNKGDRMPRQPFAQHF
jgi:hypothetical protein